MAERLTLDLELIDRVSGPAKKAADALRGIQQTAAKTSAAPSDAAHLRSLGKEEAAVRRLGLMQLNAAKMNEKFDKAKEQHHGFLASFKEKLPFRSVGDYTKGAFWGDLAAEGVSKIAEGFLEGSKIAIDFLSEGVKKAFEEGSKFEQLKVSYGLLLGKGGGKDALEDISRFSGKTRFNDDQIAGLMRPLFNAGLRGKGARQAFATSTDIEAKTGAPIEEIVGQMAKIQLRGGVTDKGLIGMGITLHPFFAELAKTQHITYEEAKKRASSGNMDPQTLLNAITAAVNKNQGGAAGSGGEQMSKTMGARWDKITNLPNEYLKHMADSPAWAALSEKLGTVLEGLSPEGPRGQKIMASLFKVFDKIADWISSNINEDSFDAFSKGVSEAIDFLVEIPPILKDAAIAAEVFATIWTGVKILNGISAVATGMTSLASVAVTGGPAIVAMGAGVATLATGLLAAAAAAGALYLAFTQIQGAAKDLGGWSSVGNDLEDFVKNGGMPDLGAVSQGNKGFDAYQQQNAANVAKAHAMGNVNVNVGGVHIVAAPGDDPEHTHQKAGEAIGKHIVNQLERAANEGG